MNGNDLLFLVVNVRKATRNEIDKRIEELGIDKMTKEERKAFDYGVDLTLNIMDLVTRKGPDEHFTIITDDKIGTEYTLKELLRKIEIDEYCQNSFAFEGDYHYSSK